MDSPVLLIKIPRWRIIIKKAGTDGKWEIKIQVMADVAPCTTSRRRRDLFDMPVRYENLGLFDVLAPVRKKAQRMKEGDIRTACQIARDMRKIAEKFRSEIFVDLPEDIFTGLDSGLPVENNQGQLDYIARNDCPGCP